jgi:predicted nucleotidyltransferase
MLESENLIDNVLTVCKVLNKHSLEYLIVGGTAVAFHGYHRMTILPSGLQSEKHDLDFWYNPTYENYFKLLNALEDLGIDVTEYKLEKAPNPRKSFFTQEFNKLKIDFLPEIIGLKKFSPSFSKRIISIVEGIEICTISYKDLLKSKENSSRQKDIDDINHLKSIKNSKD